MMDCTMAWAVARSVSVTATWTMFVGSRDVPKPETRMRPRAFSNHRWYKEKFPDYPKERRALIPFIA